jgi:hypothetical protein
MANPSWPTVKRSFRWQKSYIPTERGRELGVWAIPVRGARAEAVVEEHGLFRWGVTEVKDQQTRFVPITDRRRLTALNSQVMLCLRT